MLMISVDEVMNILEEYAVCTPDEEKSLIQRINQASMFIDNIGTVSKWISVKDRLPKIPDNSFKSEMLLCYSADDERMWFSVYEENEFGQRGFEVEKYYGACITHWMPLPKMPKENEE